MYVLKNYAQRQECIKLVKKFDEIDTTKYELAQEYLYDPLIVDGRKINMRVYLLIVCRNNKFEGYIFNDGFIYYTKTKYDANICHFDNHITTGYIDRKVYETNPLTIQDLYRHIGTYNANVLQNNINNLMQKICNALDKNVCKMDYGNATRYQIYGSDVAPLNNYEVRLMEINKGPDLRGKDDRDKALKYKLQTDTLHIIDENYKGETDFIKIY